MVTAMQQGSSTQQGTTSVTATPQQISRILLADGQWHNVQDCQLVPFAIGQAASPPSVSGHYPAIRFVQQGKEVVVPLSKVQGYEFDETYHNNEKYSEKSSPNQR